MPHAHAPAAYIFAEPSAGWRPGTRAGDWVVYALPADEADIQRGALRRIRARAHTVVTIMQQWQHPLRVHGEALAPSLWGGNAPATLEVTPAGAVNTRSHLLSAQDWVANVGDRTAYVQMLPRTARRPIPKRYLEIPPGHKAVLLTDDLGHPLEAKRAAGELYLRDGELNRPNVDESTLVWHVANPPADPREAPRAALWDSPRTGSMNVAGTIGPNQARALHRLGELADCAEHYECGIFFLPSCGPRHAIHSIPGRPWRVVWSVEGGSSQEGVCALIHDSVVMNGTGSTHHNMIWITLPPTHAPAGARTLRDILLVGCYAVGTPQRAEAAVLDLRWPQSMQAVGARLRAHHGPRVVLGDLNALDPAVLEIGGEPIFAEFLDIQGMSVAHVAYELPTWIGAGPEGVRPRRIDHILHDASAEALEITTEIAWCLRWTVDHALIFTVL
eukprot:gene10790-18045_t